MGSRLSLLTDQQSLQERTYQALRGALLDGAYLPGERIYEGAVARRSASAGTRFVRRSAASSRTACSRSGPTTESTSRRSHREEIEDIYRIRGALEATAAALAAERMTDAEIEELGVILVEQQQAAKTAAVAAPGAGLGCPGRSLPSRHPRRGAEPAADRPARADLRAGHPFPQPDAAASRTCDGLCGRPRADLRGHQAARRR